MCQLLAPISHSFLTLGWKTIIHRLHCPDSAGGPPGDLATASAPQGQVRLCYDSVPTSAPMVLGYNINQTEHPSQSPNTDTALLMQTQPLHSNSKYSSMPGDLMYLTITMLGSLSLGGRGNHAATCSPSHVFSQQPTSRGTRILSFSTHL